MLTSTAASTAQSRRIRNYRSKAFREAFSKLPPQIQEIARRKFEYFLLNPAHPSLKRGSVPNAGRPGFVVWVDFSHRAVFRQGGLPADENVYVWEWIGTAEEFQTLYMSGRGPSSAPTAPRRRQAVSVQQARKRPPSTSKRQRRNARILDILSRHPEHARTAQTLTMEPPLTTTTTTTPPQAAARPTPTPATTPPKEWTPARLGSVRAELLSLFDATGRLLVDNPKAEKELFEVMEQLESETTAKKRVQADLDQVKRVRQTLEERLTANDVRLAWLEKEIEKARGAATAELRLRQGAEVEVESLRGELQKERMDFASLRRRFDALEAEKAQLTTARTTMTETIKALEAQRDALQQEVAKLKQEKVAAVALPPVQKSGRVFLIGDFNPEQVPLSGCMFRMRPITRDKAETMLRASGFHSGLSPRVAPLIGRVIGMGIDRGRRPDLRPGDECIMVSWQSRHAPRDEYMNEDEFQVWTQWLRWDYVQILGG